jgi:pimeloyl-ACP methyl ester carboxylesterase
MTARSAALHTLIIGGAHPYAESAEAFHGVDGTDPDAFIAAMEKFAGQKAPPEARERILGCDIQALAAAMHDRDSLEDIVPTMTMPCFLFVGEADPRFPKVQECFKSMPNATFISLPGLNHSQANMRSDLVLPHVTKFLKENS